MDSLRFKTFICHRDELGKYSSPKLEEELNGLSPKDANNQDVEIARLLSNSFELFQKSKEVFQSLKTIGHLAAEREDKLLMSMVLREIQRMEGILRKIKP